MDLSANELNKVYDASQNQQELIDKRKNAYEKIINSRKNELVQVVMRQTDYDKIIAEEKLKDSEYDVIKVLNDYHGITKQEKEYPKTTNQQIYGEIRNLMDTGAKRFRLEQEQAKKYQESVERQQSITRKKSRNAKNKILSPPLEMVDE